MLAAPLGGCRQSPAPQAATISETTWLTVFPDHYELLGRRYSDRPALVSALQAVQDPSALALNSVIRPDDDETSRRALEKNLEDARAAIKEAGLAPLHEVHNEVFY
jgi:hypothetical protein